MSRFRLPARVAPSPAAEEPGLQNSAARLRSSREVQSRILAERRAPEQGGNVEGVKAQLSDKPTEELADEDLESFELPDEAEETAGTVMNAEVFHVPTSATLEEISRKMVSHKIHRVLVTDPDKGHVVGIISTMGILAAISA